MKIAYNKFFGLFFLVLIVSLQSCSSDPDSPGLEYMPDMYRSPAIEPYVDYGEIRNKVYKEKKTTLSAMIPPNGTVPYCEGNDSVKTRMNLPFILPNSAMKESHGLYSWDLSNQDTIDNYKAAANWSNPMPFSPEVEKRGEKIYTSMCMHCHGKEGDGKGSMSLSGAWAEGGGNMDYKDPAKMNLSDGQLFYSISYGKGNMGAHASILSKEEIWTLVHYVKVLQGREGGEPKQDEDDMGSENNDMTEESQNTQ